MAGMTDMVFLWRWSSTIAKQVLFQQNISHIDSVPLHSNRSTCTHSHKLTHTCIQYTLHMQDPVNPIFQIILLFQLVFCLKLPLKHLIFFAFMLFWRYCEMPWQYNLTCQIYVIIGLKSRYLRMWQHCAFIQIIYRNKKHNFLYIWACPNILPNWPAAVSGKTLYPSSRCTKAPKIV